MRLIDLNYHCNTECSDPAAIVALHQTSLAYVNHLSASTNVEIIKHINHEGSIDINGKTYTFFKRPNRFWQIPRKTHRYVLQQQPDVVIVNGFIFPFQVIKLRKKLGKSTVILLQYRGDLPPKGLRKKLQQIADKHIDKYLFTSLFQSEEWIKKKIISSREKCAELQEGSSEFEKISREKAKQMTGMKNRLNFLWVGRLEANKDPLSILKGFSRFSRMHDTARLYMVFQDAPLLDPVKQFISRDESLMKSVTLLGHIAHSELAAWYSSAEFFISGSHRESTGFALLEALSCGCIPIVTDIPSFKKITGDGKIGILYQPGDADKLFEALQKTPEMDVEVASKEVMAHFESELSFKAIASNLERICSAALAAVK